ncbi:sugar ABC transporter ATP-binding protein [Phyllobacterium sp. SB3]|uniref:sugar ABC transporter ATP-binding protein n=1 Tax=Phyllobacterium sp. SB3 TaxID=3156073 RepID=UPI0032AFA6C7
MVLFRISAVRKAFGAVRALQWNDESCIEIDTGQVWAFAGENGAGKSTLAAILAGVAQRDTGSIELDGESYSPASIAVARNKGVQIVFQEPALITSLSIAENLFLGREGQFRKFGLQFRGQMIAAARELLADICPHIDPSSIARDVSLEDQKLVETARAVSMHPRCIIFDETTAAMSSHNTELVLDLIRRLKPTTAIIIVTHRTREIFEVTDKILIMKDGKFVSVRDTDKTTPDELSGLMVGREVDLNLRSKSPDDTGSSEPLLNVSGLSIEDGIMDFNVRLNKGDIIGIGGLAGAGQEHILRAIYGLETSVKGRVVVKGHDYEGRTPKRSIDKGILFSPKNRDREGLIIRQKVRENTVMSIIDRLATTGIAIKSRETRTASRLVKQLGIKCRSVEDMCQNLSGGNRQKVVLAKLLATEGNIFLLDNPTRGIDIGARAEIYQLLNRLTAAGAGIILVSDELQELLQMSDTILVIRERKVSKTFQRADNPQEADLIRYML